MRASAADSAGLFIVVLFWRLSILFGLEIQKIMDIKNKLQSKGVLEIEFRVPWSEFKASTEEAAKKLGFDIEIPGFRKGQAPTAMIEQKLGWEKIYREGAFVALEKAWNEVIKQTTARTAGRPRVEIKKLAPQNDLEISVQFSLYPEIKLPDYKAIVKKIASKRPKEFSVSKEEMDKAVEWLCRSRASYVTVTRGAQKGDYIEISFGSMVDGNTLEGGDSSFHPFILGQGHLMPGFEDQLVGIQAGQEKDFTVRAPNDYHRKELAGKEIAFHVGVKSVQEVQMPPFDDEFAKRVGKFSGKEELKDSIRQGLEEEKQAKESRDFEDSVITALLEATPVEMPELLIEEETNSLMLETADRVESAKINLEEYLKRTNQTVEQLREAAAKQARTNLHTAFVLQELAAKEHVSVAPEELDKAIERHLEKYGNIAVAKKKNVDLASLRVYTENTLLNKKVIELLMKSAEEK